MSPKFPELPQKQTPEFGPQSYECYIIMLSVKVVEMHHFLFVNCNERLLQNGPFYVTPFSVREL